MKILLVDDKAENIYLLEKFLQGNECTTVSASNGAEALATALKNPPDMVVSDILMPVMDGFTLCREWRKDVKLQKIPFIFYTATYTDPKDEEFALSLGADRFIVKPQELNDLLKIIKDTYNTYQTKTTQPIPAPASKEKVFLKEYNEALIRKLEKKMTQIDAAEKELRQKNATLEKDIELRKQAEEALLESKERYNALFERSLDLVYVVDFDGNFIDANDAALNLLGYKREEIKSLNYASLLSEDQLPLAFKVTQEIRDTGIQKDLVEFKLQSKDGEEVYVESKGSAVMSNGIIVAIQSLARDITKRKRVEKALQDSTERYKNLTKISPVGIFHTDEKGSTTYVNPKWCQISGLSFEEALGDGWLRAVHPDDRENLFKQWQERTQLHKASFSDYRFLRSDGTIAWVMGQAIPETNSENQIVGYIGIITDITERKRMEEELLHESDRRRMFFDQIPDGIVIIDTQTAKFIDFNTAAHQQLGYSREEFSKLGISDVEARETKEETRATIARAISEGRIDFETHQRTKQGDIRNVYVTAQYIDILGTPIYQCLWHDITESKAMEEKLRQVQKLEGLGTLAGGIAHDFNNILGIILAYITSIKRFTGDTKKLDLATDTIVKAVQRGKTLVQQVLTFARKTETAFGAVDVNNVVMETVTMVMETFPKIITCSQNFEKSIPYINADRSQLHQVLMNLCVNARDAMPKGGVLSITTRLVSVASLRNHHPEASEKSYICIEVRDTGEGMTEETRRRIFEPFFTTKEVGKGTGLGLSVTFGVIQTHKGFIDVESELGNGTTFRVYLPASQVAEPIRETEEETLEEMPGGTETILVVEDEEMLAIPLKMALNDKGYKVIYTGDGLQALKIYEEKKNEIDIVITDLGLPNISGLEVCQKIRQINPKERMILATGFLDPEMKEKFLKAGIEHFLYKPYDLTKVVKTIRNVLDEK